MQYQPLIKFTIFVIRILHKLFFVCGSRTLDTDDHFIKCIARPSKTEADHP